MIIHEYIKNSSLHIVIGWGWSECIYYISSFYIHKFNIGRYIYKNDVITVTAVKEK